MKLLSYLRDEREQLGVLIDGYIYDMEMLHPELPGSMNMFLNYWDDFFPIAKAAERIVQDGGPFAKQGIPAAQVSLLAFRQHVAAARRNRKVEMIPQFDEYPIFYFTNHHSIQGPGPIRCMPDHFEKLDFELEAAIVIGRPGRNIRADKADQHIAGLMIMNDMSARTLQMEEMLLNLGPAKGKDFSTVIGPWLVTLDELEAYEIAAKPGHTGKSWDLEMRCHVNGKQVSFGKLSDMDWTFAEIIERASYGVDLYPGDVIGSGTVGTGCFLELNGTGKLQDANYPEQWLQPGDTVEMTIDALGTLTNTIVKEETDWSILQQKKKQPS
jgi:fumarylacetoacetate (FAA) hydrolase